MAHKLQSYTERMQKVATMLQDSIKTRYVIMMMVMMMMVMMVMLMILIQSR